MDCAVNDSMNEFKFGKHGEADEKRLRVLHIAGWYPTKKDPVAGIFVREHVKATALYNDVAVICSEVTDRKIHSFYQIEDSIEDGIHTMRLTYGKLPIPKISYFIYVLGIFRTFRKLVERGFRPEIIHAHVYSAGVPTVLIGKRYRLPVVITEHFSGFPRRLVRGIEKLKAKFAFEKADLVCPVSEDLRRHIESYGIRARFHVIPNVVDTALFAPKDTASTREGNRKSLLLVALLNPLKGVPYLLEALALLRKKRDDFVLDIVGDGPYRAEYEELTRKLSLQDIVRFHGLKTKPEVAEFMRKADVFVLPSEWENLPCVLLEAMASGLPIVATKVGGIPEIVSDEAGVLVPPKDVKALSEAMDFILEHLDRYQGGNVAEQAKQRFGYKAVGQALDKLYKELVSARRPQR